MYGHGRTRQGNELMDPAHERGDGPRSHRTKEPDANAKCQSWQSSLQILPDDLRHNTRIRFIVRSLQGVVAEYTGLSCG